jgi:hypothetical protein
VDQFALEPLVIRRLNGDLGIKGRHIRLTNAQGQLYGGTVTGSFDTTLLAVPRYEVKVAYDGVDLSALSGASDAISGRFGGLASGEAIFRAHGASRTDLLASIECRGTMEARGVELRMIDLTASLHSELRRPGTSRFPRASTSFSCEKGGLHFQDLVLSGAETEIDGEGTLDPNRAIDFQLQTTSDGPEAVQTAAESDDASPAGPDKRLYRLSGSLSAPEVTRTPASSRHRQ